MDLLRTGIRSYNTACGIANTDSSGYHETVTRFYVLLIADFLERQDLSVPIDDLAAALINALGDKALLLDYFTPERLMSKQARRQWVEPDLRAVPSPS